MEFEENGLEAWEENAEFWDDYMGDESNFFHRDLVRPYVDELLDVDDDDYILDIACGNGNYSAHLAEQGASVLAFDYSETMIDLAMERREDVLDLVEFVHCDGNDPEELEQLRRDEPFTKAVCNMALMDMSKLSPLFHGVYELLDQEGIFVFAMHHPCFTFENQDYLSNAIYRGEAIDGQPVLQNYYHRTLSQILQLAFEVGFVLDGFHEVPFQGHKIPIIIIARLRKEE